MRPRAPVQAFGTEQQDRSETGTGSPGHGFDDFSLRRGSAGVLTQHNIPGRLHKSHHGHDTPDRGTGGKPDRT